MAKVRDKRQLGFFILENAIIDDYAKEIGVAGVAIYALIVRHADRETRRTWPTYATMTARLGVSRRTCARVVKRLVSLGLLEVTRSPGAKSIYTLKTGQAGADLGPEPPGGNAQSTGSVVSVVPFPGGTGGSALVAPPQFPSGTTPANAPYRGIQDPTTTTAAVAVAGDPLGAKNAFGAALLTSQGVSPAVADDLANTTDLDLLNAIVAYWQAGAGGTKEVGTGLLVSMCRRPVAYGFVLRDGVWYAPKITARSKRSASSSSSAAAESPSDKARRLAAEAKARREADAKAAAEFRSSPKISRG